MGAAVSRLHARSCGGTSGLYRAQAHACRCPWRRSAGLYAGEGRLSLGGDTPCGPMGGRDRLDAAAAGCIAKRRRLPGVNAEQFELVDQPDNLLAIECLSADDAF